jgi:putative transcriptional regulator
MIKFNIKVQQLLHDNMSQKQLSELTGIRLPTLSKYENGTAKTICVEYFNKLCEVFNCQISDLIVYCPNDDKCPYCFIK